MDLIHRGHIDSSSLIVHCSLLTVNRAGPLLQASASSLLASFRSPTRPTLLPPRTSRLSHLGVLRLPLQASTLSASYLHRTAPRSIARPLRAEPRGAKPRSRVARSHTSCESACDSTWPGQPPPGARRLQLHARGSFPFLCNLDLGHASSCACRVCAERTLPLVIRLLTSRSTRPLSNSTIQCLWASVSASVSMAHDPRYMLRQLRSPKAVCQPSNQGRRSALSAQHSVRVGVIFNIQYPIPRALGFGLAPQTRTHSHFRFRTAPPRDRTYSVIR